MYLLIKIIYLKSLKNIFYSLEMKRSISIVIPTFGRPEILKDSLDCILDSCKRYEIPIYISDDSIDSDTELIIQEIKLKYPFISYKRNIPSLGHDNNLMHSLKLPNSDFVWLIGDSILINENAISNMIDFISQNHYDIILMNTEARIDYPSKDYNNSNEILAKFGWHSTLTGVAIYSKNVIALADKINFDNCMNFPQFTLIYNYLSINCSFYWVNEICLKSNNKKKSYWVKHVFSTWIDDWENAVINLPESYDQTHKKNAIISHSKKTKIFGLKSLLNLRMQGIYNWKKFKEYEDSLSFHSDLRKAILINIAIFPRVIIKFCHRILSINKRLVFSLYLIFEKCKKFKNQK